MEIPDDSVFRIKNMDIELTKEEWSCLRLLFPMAIGPHSEYVCLERKHIEKLRHKLSNISDSNSKNLAKELIKAVEAEDALEINFTREIEPSPDHPPIN